MKKKDIMRKNFKIIFHVNYVEVRLGIQIENQSRLFVEI